MSWVAQVSACALLANGAVEIGMRGLQLGGLFWRRDLPPGGAGVRPPSSHAFVSVHVAICNEPPRLVEATLRSLAACGGCAFEVIVVDNNTGDPALWRPVEALTRDLGPRFRFLHFDRLAGAKAGALNVALGIVDPRTTHVAVVDADYQVHPDFLREGLCALAASGADYAQFPQAYRDSQAARGVEHELGDYFASFAGSSGRAGSMLPTGTLSLFDARALEAVGGWPTATITEDAEIGVRLQAAGFRGVWLAQERGAGLLPLDFAGLRKQRARWVAGNVQVLRQAVARSTQLDVGARVDIVVQLTAWVSLWLAPAVVLAVAAGAYASMETRALTQVASATILLSAALTATRLAVSRRRTGSPLRAWGGAIAAKLALSWTSAAAWLPALQDRALPFHRTLKALDGGRRGGVGWPLAATSLLFAGLAALYLTRAHYAEAAACALLALAWPCALKVDADLKEAARQAAVAG